MAEGPYPHEAKERTVRGRYRGPARPMPVLRLKPLFGTARVGRRLDGHHLRPPPRRVCAWLMVRVCDHQLWNWSAWQCHRPPVEEGFFFSGALSLLIQRNIVTNAIGVSKNQTCLAAGKFTELLARRCASIFELRPSKSKSILEKFSILDFISKMMAPYLPIPLSSMLRTALAQSLPSLCCLQTKVTGQSQPFAAGYRLDHLRVSVSFHCPCRGSQEVASLITRHNS